MLTMQSKRLSKVQKTQLQFMLDNLKSEIGPVGTIKEKKDTK